METTESTTASDHTNYTEFDNPYAYDRHLEHPLEVLLSCSSLFYAAPAFYIVFRLSVRFVDGRLKGSFQTLILIFGVNDILCYVMQMLAIRLPYWGTVTIYSRFTEGFVPTFLYFGLLTVTNFQTCGCIFLSLNRASSALFPFSYERMWKSYGIWLLLVVTVCMQYLTYEILFIGAKYYRLGPNVYVIGGVGDSFYYFGSRTLSVYTAGCILCFSLNTYTGVTLYYQLKQRDRLVQLTEIKFFHVCMVTLICHTMMTFKQWLEHYADPQSSLQMVVFAVGPIIYDCNCFLPLYSLMVLSKDLRRLVFPRSSGKKAWKTPASSTGCVGGTKSADFTTITTF